MDYGTARDKLQTGDVVLFSGKGGISEMIKWFSDSKWSHVGMVLVLKEWDFVLLWESTTLSDIPDLDTGKATKGVQLVALSQRIGRYNGEVAFRHLSQPLAATQMEALDQFRQEVKGRAYEESNMELIRAAWDSWGGQNTEDLSSLFCSELVAETYQRIGLLPEDLPSNEYTPGDFATQDIGVNGQSLGPLWTLERTDAT